MAKHVSIDTREIKRLSADLGVFTKVALPIANQKFLNNSAADAMRQGRSIIKVDMILKNKFTERSILFNPTRKTLKINRMFSAMGSTQEYMADQQLGAVKTKKTKVGIPIPTSEAANQGNQNPRTKLPISPNKLQNIVLRKSKKRGANRKQRNLIKIRESAKARKKFVFLELAKSKGIFKLKGIGENLKLRMIYSFSEDSVTIPKTPWLTEAADATRLIMPRLFLKELRAQITRHRIFRG